ncbi:MAG: hypothetical protein JOZ86_09740 [Candidatus Eremiobacteraeota bacterium]|nr:hypothetical protein [Candidatus Eremiobacteraeota bacterium]
MGARLRVGLTLGWCAGAAPRTRRAVPPPHPFGGRGSIRFVAITAFAFALIGSAALAQPVEAPSPTPPSASPSASVTPSPAPPAGVIPPTITVNVTGSPGTDGDVLYAQVRAAVDRAIRPSLRTGGALHDGAVAPWPVPPLAAGGRTAVNVTTTLDGDENSSPVTGTTTVWVYSLPAPPPVPSLLFLSDDPEYLDAEGLVFRGAVAPQRPARLYYYHSDVGVPRDLDVVLTADAPSRVQLVEADAGPDLDVMSVGHSVSRDFLRYELGNEGTIVDLVPGRPFVLRHALILQGELAAGAVDVQVLSGATVGVSVVASPAGGHPEQYLAGPRVPFDGHNRHGIFALDGYGALAESYDVGTPDVAVRYGGRTPTPRNVDPHDPGHDFGDYGILHRITFTLRNPTDAPSLVYLYEKPLGGPLRSSFLVDGQLKELGCVRVPQPYWIQTYQLPAHTDGASTTVTMPDGGSYYPVEFGVTGTQPQLDTPPVGAPQGCSSAVTPFAEPTATN